MSKAYIGLGGNLEGAKDALLEAVRTITEELAVKDFRLSSLYLTEPIDSSGPDYFNAVLEIETEFGAEALLDYLLKLEKKLGRVRPKGVHNAPRIIDLDLLAYGSEESNTDFLILPHPRIYQRAFVLVPLSELSENLHIPGQGVVKDLVVKVKDQRIKKVMTASDWLSTKEQK